MAKPLTKAEEQIMLALWKIDKGYIRDIIEALPNPKPHQNTVATIVKILVEKEFIGITPLGRHNEYYPIVTKDDYTKRTMKNLVKGYFEGSFTNMVSFFVKENNLSVEELEDLLQQIKNTKKSKK